MDLKIAHVACAQCRSLLCSYNSLEIAETFSNTFICIMRGIFGTVIFDRNDNLEDPFVKNHIDMYHESPGAWA